MKRIAFFLIISFLIISFTSCKKNADLSKEEVFTIMNEIIKDNNFDVSETCSTFDKQLRSVAFLFEFSQYDKKFVLHQIEINKDLKIKKGNLKSFSTYQKKWHDVIVDSSCDHDILTVFAFPLISSDRKSVIFGFYSPGQGGEYLFKKQNDHWILKKTFEHWVD